MSPFNGEIMEMGRAKVCLVTVGATAPFNSLIQEVLSGPFLAQLKKYDYTHLIMQTGKEGTPLYYRFIETHPPDSKITNGIKIKSVEYLPNMAPFLRLGLSDMVTERERGMLICHAGTGSILDGLRVALPMMVVPNPDLADNHQEELAAELDKIGWVVKASLGTVAAAVDEVEAKRGQRRVRPPSELGLQQAIFEQIPNVD